MIVTHTHRDTGRGRSRLHAPGARRGIRSWVSRITPWAKGRRQTTAPPRDPPIYFILTSVLSAITLAILGFLWLLFAWCICFHPATFRVFVSFDMKWVSCSWIVFVCVWGGGWILCVFNPFWLSPLYLDCPIYSCLMFLFSFALRECNVLIF